MIIGQEEAAKIVGELIAGDIKINPTEFWEELGWDANTLYAIAQVGQAINLGDADNVMVAMQMGAALALKGLENKKKKPSDHLMGK